MSFGCQSMVKSVKRMLLKHPKDAFLNQETVNAQWRDLGHLEAADYEKAVAEYDGFVSLLSKTIPEIDYLPSHDQTGLDSIYVHDAVIVTSRGAILCNMGKNQRRHEPSAVGKFLPHLGIPILGWIRGEGTLEGGDVVWVDERTLAVGRGYRTNDDGIRQLRRLTAEFVDELTVVPLPHWGGPGDVLHLMSLLSPVDDDMALVYSRLLPIPFREWLLARGIKLLEVPNEEYCTLGCNVLAVAPRKCIMISGNSRTRGLLEAHGVEVSVFGGEDICTKGAGGPTCLTRPLLRV
jgi:N-dimethylarginine dimethylaminohydrolase